MVMANAQKTSTVRRAKAASSPCERPFVYRGIKIQPMPGKRSPLAEAIREGFRAMNDTTRGDPAEG